MPKRFDRFLTFVTACNGSIAAATPLTSSPPILPRSNDWNLTDPLHIEQITIDADQECALATDCGAQDGYVGRIPTQVWRQIGRLNNHGSAAQKCSELVSLALGKAEFLHELSLKFPKYEFGGYKLMVQ